MRMSCVNKVQDKERDRHRDERVGRRDDERMKGDDGWVWVILK